MTVTIKATVLSATLMLAMGQSAFAAAPAAAPNDPCITGKISASMQGFCKRTGNHGIRCDTSGDGPLARVTGNTVPGVCDVQPGDVRFAKAQGLCAEFCGGSNAVLSNKELSDALNQKAPMENAMVASPEFRKCKVKATSRQDKNLDAAEVTNRVNMVCQFLYSQNLIYDQIIPAYLGDRLTVTRVGNGFKLGFEKAEEMKAYAAASNKNLVDNLYEKVQNLLARNASEKEMVDSLSPEERVWLRSKEPYSGENDKERFILDIMPFQPLLKPFTNNVLGGW